MIPGTETCDCCDGIDANTPRGLANRMGLSAVAYRIGEYAQFRESMLAGLSSSKYAQLDRLRTRDADDFTLGLIDAVACAADVLTFYQERLANESYLRTATERVSLQEMAKLIGYRLRPGVAAETRLAFALEAPKKPPPGLPPEPGAFVTGIPVSLTLAAGLKVQSVPGPDEKPQTFETVEEVAARPEWNAVRPWLSDTRSPGFGAKDTWLHGVRNNLKAGDALLFVGDEFLAHPTTNNNWDFRLIDSVELDIANDRTHVTWRRGLGSVTPHSNPAVAPQVHVLRREVGVFGNNAPMWRSMNTEFKNNYLGDAADTPSRAAPSPGDWPAFNISALSANVNGGHVDLDAVLAEVSPGGFVVLAKGEFNRPDESFPPHTYVELYKVTSTAEVSRAEFALSGKVTRLGLAGQNLDEQFFKFPRETSVYAQSERLALAPYPVTAPITGDQLPLAVSADGLQPERRLIIKGEFVNVGGVLVHEATLVSVQANANGSVLTITPRLPVALKRDTVVVHANVALATHGETVSQILGSGDASKAFQRFELKRMPLTYRSATNETGADSELTVRIGDVEWAERPTMFGTPPTERAYTLNTDEHGKTWVVFGDGVRGARLPTGVNNVRTSYRQGLGQEGNVSPEKLTQLATRPLGLKSVSNPVAAQGGTDPEPADQARRTMPLGTRTLGRAVSLLDYEDFAIAFTGIAKAQAQVLQLPGGPTIAITVAGQDGTALSSSNPVWNNLLLALKASGDPHVNVVLLSYQASSFHLGLKVKRDPAYESKPLLAAVEAALRVHYSFASRSLAQPVLQSDVIAVAHSVPGVVAVDLDFLFGGTEPGAARIGRSLQKRLLASRMRVSNGVAQPAELLTLAA
ncbi:MAG TPA: putative baseplate assembly protein, partial [Chloroflexota bacterium]|nr:putative baseplate assembly protein [Chloroflexota bacterium]